MIKLLLGLDHSLYCMNFENICEQCAKLGLDGIEIQPEHPDIWKDYPNSYKKIRDILDSYEFKVAVHAPIKDLNMASYNERIRKITINELMIARKFAENINAEYFLIHAGKNSFISKSQVSNWWKKKALGTCIDTITNLSQDIKCKLTMENMIWSEHRLSSKKKFLIKIFQEFPIDTLFFTLDIEHALERSKIFVQKLLELFGKRLISIHTGNYNRQRFIFDFLKSNMKNYKNFQFLVLEPHSLGGATKKDILFSLIDKNIKLIQSDVFGLT